MSDDRLAIWLYGIRVAVVERERRRMRLRYTPEALESFPGGTPLLSVTVPLSDRSFPNGVVGTLLDGVLPEGQMRLTIAAELGLRADDSFGLARELGRDCAGALVIAPDTAPAPPPALTSSAEPLTDDELARLLANLREAPLGVDDRVRISLAGVQEKLLLTRLSDGGWGRPVDGTPSTHILKPEIRGYPGTVENEAFCMRLANRLGLPVAAVTTTAPAGRKLIVVARYDRVVHDDGEVERIHQEDFCQATGTPPQRKYEEDGGPSLRKIAALLASVERGALITLLGAVTLNVLIGNGDAHAKNFSLLHGADDPVVRLAPLYDVLSTMALEITDGTGAQLHADTHMGQHVGGQAGTRGNLRRPHQRGHELGHPPPGRHSHRDRDDRPGNHRQRSHRRRRAGTRSDPRPGQAP